MTQFYNDACRAPLHGKHPGILGQPAAESWREVWSDLEPPLQRAVQGESVLVKDFEFLLGRSDGSEPASFALSFSAFGGPAQNEGISITAIETTGQLRAETAARHSDQRLRAIVESATEYAIITLDVDGCISSWNSGAERLLGYREEEVIGRPGEIFFTPEDRASDKPEIEMAQTREYGRAEDERWHVRKDGSQFWGSGVMLPLEGAQRDRYLKIFRDKSKLRHLQERQHLLMHELNHRLKNTLAVVQSIARQSLRRPDCSESAREALELRLVALAKAQDVLTAGDWRGGDLRVSLEAVLRQVAPDMFDDRVRLQGPDIHLGANALVGLSLACHELVTNALKYGALSDHSGVIDIDWEIEHEEPYFRLKWSEQGGPPVAPPSRKGFGTRVISEGLAQEFGATVDLNYAKEGLECTIRAPLRSMTSRSGP